MSKPPVNVLSEANVNHLRRLLGYVRCEIGQSPDEYVDTMRQIAPYVGTPDEAAQQRIMAGYQASKAVPKYVRAAIKALEPVVRGSSSNNAESTVLHGGSGTGSAPGQPRNKGATIKALAHRAKEG